MPRTRSRDAARSQKDLPCSPERADMRPAPKGGGDEEPMDPKTRKVGEALIALGRMKMAELRAKYAEVFGGETTSHNAAFLRKKIAWRIQELAEGGVTERAKARIAELGRDAPLRERPREIALLARTFLDAARARLGRPPTTIGAGVDDLITTQLHAVDAVTGAPYTNKLALASFNDHAHLSCL